MASYTSATRLTGLSSGIDTDSYVKQLMSAASTRYNSYQRNLQKLQWKQSAYRDVAKKITDFQSKWLDITSSTSLRMQKTFTSKYSADVTKEDGSSSTSISVSNVTKSGSHTVKVTQAASAAKAASSASVSGKLDTSSGSASFVFSYDGTDYTIDVSQNAVANGTAADEINAELSRRNLSGLTAAVDSSGNMSITSTVAGHAMSVAPTNASNTNATVYTVNYGDQMAKFRVSDNGNGNYSLTYTAKNSSGTYETHDLAVSLDGITDNNEKIQTLLNKGLETVFGNAKDADGNDLIQDGSTHQAVTAAVGTDGTLTLSAATTQKYAIVTTNPTEPKASASTENDVTTVKYDYEDGSGSDNAHTFEITGNSTDGFKLKVDGQEYTSGDNYVSESGTYANKDDLEAALNKALSENYHDISIQEDLDGSPSDVAPVKATVDDNGKATFSFTPIKEKKAVDDVPSTSFTKADLTRTDSTSGFEAVKSNSKVGIDSYISSVIGQFDGTKTINIGGSDITIYEDTKISDFINSVNSSGAGVKMSYNAVSGAFTLETTETGASKSISFNNDATKEVFSALGFDTSETYKGKDAELEVDGVRTVSATNKLAFEEFTADITYATVGTEFTVKSSRDTDAIYNLVKDFVNDYNEMVSSITGTTKENRVQGPKGYYEPLTDDDKEAMKDSDIEKWETNAKKGLLYGDKLLTGYLSKIRSSVYSVSQTNSNGKTVGIYNYGITTSSDMSKAGQLVLDETKFKEAIENDPDTVISLITSVADKLNDVAKQYTGTHGLISEKAGVVGGATEFSNSLNTEINSLKKKMSTEYTRLQSKEEKLFAMFSKMESSIGDNNSTLDSLYSFMGM